MPRCEIRCRRFSLIPPDQSCMHENERKKKSCFVDYSGEAKKTNEEDFFLFYK